MAGDPGQDGVIGPTGAPVNSIVLFLLILHVVMVTGR